MPIDLSRIVDPPTTALVISECQRDVVGDLSKLPALAEAATGAVRNIAALVEAARAANVQVIHARAYVRTDGKGANTNTRISAALRRRLAEGAPAALDPEASSAIVDEIRVMPSDIVLTRIHGMSPMHDTGLDSILRNLGVATVVVTGVSLNIAVPNLVMDAVNCGYTVCVPRDAVAGTPPEYGAAVLENTIGYLAYLTTTKELIELWSPLT